MNLKWRDFASCADAADPDLWFPIVDSPAFDTQTARAKAICRGCLVRADCLAWALKRLPHGIAGGLTEHERALARKNTARRLAAAVEGAAAAPTSREDTPAQSTQRSAA